ncbi:winged helix DNA-binding protein [Staphylococcus simulans]|uniref:MarR family winged helix-turn-helix transcriptional regulator n=1 Tax=Staphylococcus simulans TaxID=1286 RepID=UPI000D03325E|nr:MarR family transcriptional regulator [Staphylococcus simulans]MCD8915500.1 winged helix DNA-binding protein [Staphylococcus simulans]
MSYDMEEALTRFDISLMNINKTISEMLQEAGLQYTVSREQLEALIIIHTHRRLTINELAQKQGIFKTAASKRIYKLEKIGLVQQAPSENKRIKLMEMTEEGAQFLVDVKRKMAHIVEDALDGQLTTKEIVRFVDQLQIIEEALKQRRIKNN